MLKNLRNSNHNFQTGDTLNYSDIDVLAAELNYILYLESDLFSSFLLRTSSCVFIKDLLYDVSDSYTVTDLYVVDTCIIEYPLLIRNWNKLLDNI